MKIEEIKQILNLSGKEVDIFLPNELFEDLQLHVKDSTHIAYAYCYVYLAHFLYRNCKHFNTMELLDSAVLKQVLGYSESNRTMNYITKKGGVLEEIGYLESTKIFPMTWSYENNSGNELSFFLSSEIDKDMLPPIPKMFFLKRPLKGFTRIIERKDNGKIEEEEIQGTFFDVTSTHSVDFNVFLYCMANDELGVVAFYLYSWLKQKNDVYGGFDVSLTDFSDKTGVSKRTLINYLDFLKGYNMIKFRFNQKFFVVGMFDEDRKATTYYTASSKSFLDKPVPFEKMPVMKRKEYLELKDQTKKKIRDKAPIVELELSTLPY